MSARLKPAQSELVEDTLLVKPSVEAPAIRLADLKNDPTGRSSLGNVDPLGRLGRLQPLAFAPLPDHIFHWRSSRLGLAIVSRRDQRSRLSQSNIV